MASFDSLVKEILPYVPGCPDSLIKTHLRAATIELCEKSKAFTHDLDPITTISGVYEYEFDQPSGTDVHQILWATYDGNDLDPISPRSLELNYPDWRNKSGIPTVYLQKTPDTFWLVYWLNHYHRTYFGDKKDCTILSTAGQIAIVPNYIIYIRLITKEKR